MKPEWPITGPPIGAPLEAAPDQPLLPLAFEDHVALIRAGAAIDAFARKRAVQIVTHGHTPESDLERSPGHLAHEAKARLHAFCDVMPRGRMNLPPDKREQLIRYVEVSAAILLALWDRCQVEVPE